MVLLSVKLYPFCYGSLRSLSSILHMRKRRNCTYLITAWAGGVNCYNAVKLLRDPSDLHQAITLWCTVNVFVLVRVQLASSHSNLKVALMPSVGMVTVINSRTCKFPAGNVVKHMIRVTDLMSSVCSTRCGTQYI